MENWVIITILLHIARNIFLIEGERKIPGTLRLILFIRNERYNTCELEITCRIHQDSSNRSLFVLHLSKEFSSSFEEHFDSQLTEIQLPSITMLLSNNLENFVVDTRLVVLLHFKYSPFINRIWTVVLG